MICHNEKIQLDSLRLWYYRPRARCALLGFLGSTSVAAIIRSQFVSRSRSQDDRRHIHRRCDQHLSRASTHVTMVDLMGANCRFNLLETESLHSWIYICLTAYRPGFHRLTAVWLSQFLVPNGWLSYHKTKCASFLHNREKSHCRSCYRFSGIERITVLTQSFTHPSLCKLETHKFLLTVILSASHSRRTLNLFRSGFLPQVRVVSWFSNNLLRLVVDALLTCRQIPFRWS